MLPHAGLVKKKKISIESTLIQYFSFHYTFYKMCIENLNKTKVFVFVL
jgi:hypothetical protein